MDTGLTIKKIFNGVLRRFFGTQIMKVHYLGTKTRSCSTDIDELVKPLEYNDFLLGDKEVFDEQKLNILKNRFLDSTYLPYGMVDNGELIYSGWISLNKLGLPVELKKFICLGINQGYLEDAYCSVNSRGKGIHTKMILYCLNILHNMCKKVAITTIVDGNLPAIKANIKNGMVDVGVFYCGRILGRPFCTLTPKKKAKFDSKIQ